MDPLQQPNQPQQPPAPSYPPQTQQPPMGTSDHVVQTFLPTKNMPALLAYYFGIFGLIPFIGIPLAVMAIVFGVIGLNKYKQTPTPGAKGHAIAGLVLGIFEFIVLIVFIVIVATSSTSP